MNTTSTRRSLLKLATSAAAYGAGVTTLSMGAVVATATNTAKAATVANVASPELARLIAEYRAADERLDQFYQAVWNPRVDRENALIEAVPHTVASVPNGNDVANSLTLTTASKSDVARCRGILSIPRPQQSQSASWQQRYDAAVKIMAGDKRRAEAIARIHTQTGMDDANRIEKEMDQHANGLLDKVTAFPVRSLLDLQTKFAFQRERGRGEDVIVDMVEADLSRLLSGEA